VRGVWTSNIAVVTVIAGTLAVLLSGCLHASPPDAAAMSPGDIKPPAAWVVAEGEWQLTAAEMHEQSAEDRGYLLFREPVATNAVRVEFDGMSTNPGDLGVLLGCTVHQMGDYLGVSRKGTVCAAIGKTRSVIQCRGVVVATNAAALITPGRWHHVVVQRAGGVITLELDGREVLRAPDLRDGLFGPYLALYAWNEGSFRNVRIRTWADPVLDGYLTPLAHREMQIFPTTPVRPEITVDTVAALTPETVAARIQQYRTADVRLMLKGADGVPITNQPVRVRMLRHRFLFGCNAFLLDPASTAPAQLIYQEKFARIFNFATVGFYWSGFEKKQGQPETAWLMAQARWLQSRDIRVKGHPLAWRQTVPAWLPPDAATGGALSIARVTRDVTAFRGVIGTWDVINEVTDWREKVDRYDNALSRLYEEVGTVELVRRVFDAARRADPDAVLLINDYQLGPDYEALVARCRAAGVRIDAIGLQSHMHSGAWKRENTWAAAERLGRAGLPLHFTEVTIPSGEPLGDRKMNKQERYENWPTTPEGEAQQAAQVEDFYRVLFSHPAVQAITWWDFSDSHAWMAAPAGLLRADMSSKPAYEVLEKLIRGEWWTPEQSLVTDSSGAVSFHGFLGEYEVLSGGRAVRFEVDRPGSTVASVTW